MNKTKRFLLLTSIFTSCIAPSTLFAQSQNRIQNHDFTQKVKHWNYRANPALKYLEDKTASDNHILQVGFPQGQIVNEKQPGYFAGACQFLSPVPSAGSSWTLAITARVARKNGPNTQHSGNASIELHFADNTTKIIPLISFTQDDTEFTTKQADFTFPDNVTQARIWLKMPVDTTNAYNETRWYMNVDHLSFTTQKTTAITPPSKPTVTAIGARTTQITWPKITNATGYRITRTSDNTKPRTVIIDSPINTPSNSYLDYTVNSEQTYTYSVTAINDSSESAASSSTTITTPALTLSPGNTTYYIDSSLGNDSNSGLTSQKPFKSLYKISTLTLAPGDKILFKRGNTYTGNLVLSGSGTANNPIIISSYGSGPRPHIQGNGINNNMGTFTIRNSSHYKFTNLEISNQGRRRGYFAGILAIAEEGSGDQRGFTVRNCFFHDVNNIATKTRMPRSAISFNAKSLTGLKDIPDQNITRFHDILIENNRFERCDIQGVGLYSDFRKHPRLRHQVNHTNVVIRGNYLEDSTNDAFSFAMCTDSLAEYNLIRRIGLGRIHDNAGITTFRSINCTSQFNVVGDVYGFSGQAFDFDHETVNCQVQYNLSYNNHAGIVTMLSGGSHSDLMRYNISANDVLFPGVNNAVIRSIDYDKTKSYTTGIYNNTIYIANKDRMYKPYDLKPVALQSQSNTAIIYNNLIYIDDNVQASNDYTREGDFKSNSFFGQGDGNEIYDSINSHNHVFKDINTIRNIKPLIENIYNEEGLDDPTKEVDGKNIYISRIKPLITAFSPSLNTFDSLSDAINADNTITIGATPITAQYNRNNNYDALGNPLPPTARSRGAINIPTNDLGFHYNFTVNFPSSSTKPQVRIYDTNQKLLAQFPATTNNSFTWDGMINDHTRLDNTTYRAVIEITIDNQTKYYVEDFAITNSKLPAKH
ncbi:hypothetical protein JD969_17595 [Planctomycetota bacterium]|nr:hypothetical protein JD969_17595 [Planctomycetota bacterium]